MDVRQKVLVVEDDEAIRRLVVRALRGPHVAVLEAADLAAPEPILEREVGEALGRLVLARPHLPVGQRLMRLQSDLLRIALSNAD